MSSSMSSMTYGMLNRKNLLYALRDKKASKERLREACNAFAVAVSNSNNHERISCKEYTTLFEVSF